MRNERLAWLAVSALGPLVVWYATSNGVGVSMDSMTYIRGAENLAHGHGYAVVSQNGGLESVTHWPPLYSMAVSGPVFAGLSAVTAVRVINALSLCALLLFTMLLVKRLARRSRTAPVLAAICVLVSPDIVQCYPMAWSETLFLPLVVLAFLLTMGYSERGRMRDLVAAGACFGLAVVCRYSGAAFVAGVLAWIVFFDRGRTVKARLVRALAFATISGIPTALLFIRNFFATSSAHDRPFEPRFFTPEHVRIAAESVTRWLLPSWVPLRLRVLWFAGVVVLVFFCMQRNRDAMRRVSEQVAAHGGYWIAIALCVAAYLGFVAVTIVFFDFDVQFDPRMMSPILVLAIVAMAALASAIFVSPLTWTARISASALVASLLLLGADTASRLRDAHHEPAQFASDRWVQARAWELLKSVPESASIYSTSPYVSQYFLHRSVQPLAEATPSGEAYLLWYPGHDGAEAALADDACASLRAVVLDSTDVVVLYRISGRLAE